MKAGGIRQEGASLVKIYSSEKHGPGEPIALNFKDASVHAVLEFLSRRPATVEDLAAGLDLKPNEVVKLVTELLRSGAVVQEEKAGRLYYRPAR